MLMARRATVRWRREEFKRQGESVQMEDLVSWERVAKERRRGVCGEGTTMRENQASRPNAKAARSGPGGRWSAHGRQARCSVTGGASLAPAQVATDS